MTRRSTQQTYGSIARTMHWCSLALISLMVMLGMTMTRIDGGANDAMYRAHVAVGLLVSVITIARVIWRIVEPTPEPIPMPPWRRRLYLANHYGLYIGLVLLALTGISILVSNDAGIAPWSIHAADIEESSAGDAHFALVIVYTGLYLMHVIGVLSYQRTKGDVLARMGVRAPSPQT